MNRNDDDFVVRLTSFQSRLYAYVLSLLGDPDQAADVLQETNLVLWRKAGEFVPGSSFSAWACKVAHFQVLAHRQTLGREQVVFSDSLLDQIAERVASRSEQFEKRQEALHYCIRAIPSRQRRLIERHYHGGQSLNAIAIALNKPANAIAQAMFRARKALLRCINARISKGDLA